MPPLTTEDIIRFVHHVSLTKVTPGHYYALFLKAYRLFTGNQLRLFTGQNGAPVKIRGGDFQGHDGILQSAEDDEGMCLVTIEHPYTGKRGDYKVKAIDLEIDEPTRSPGISPLELQHLQDLVIPFAHARGLTDVNQDDPKEVLSLIQIHIQTGRLPESRRSGGGGGGGGGAQQQIEREAKKDAAKEDETRPTKLHINAAPGSTVLANINHSGLSVASPVPAHASGSRLVDRTGTALFVGDRVRALTSNPDEGIIEKFYQRKGDDWVRFKLDSGNIKCRACKDVKKIS
jgi:hypothetical protein